MVNENGIQKPRLCLCKDYIHLSEPEDIPGLNAIMRSILMNMYQASNAIPVSDLVEFKKNNEKLSSAPDDIRLSIDPGQGGVQDFIICSPRTAPEPDELASIKTVYCNQFSHLWRGTKDKLTTLYNREYFSQVMANLQKENLGIKKRQNQVQRILAILDIDHFKNINDTYGHLFGDEILVLVARLMQETFRFDDFLFRYGGEEFVVILNNIDEENAFNVLERFREKVSSFKFPQELMVTISIGFCNVKPELMMTDILEMADKALYYSKEHGRNQSSNYNTLMDSKLIESFQERDNDIELF